MKPTNKQIYRYNTEWGEEPTIMIEEKKAKAVEHYQKTSEMRKYVLKLLTCMFNKAMNNIRVPED